VTPRETKSLWGTGGHNLIVAAIALVTLVSAFWLGASSWNDGNSRQSASWNTASWVSGSNEGSLDDPAAVAGTPA
jgi:hypothetical protein